MRPRAVIALARRDAALRTNLWQQAVEIRREWLDIGFSTEPADRQVTEEAIASIYHRRPRFVWVDSPRAALEHLHGLPTHEDLRSWVASRRPPGRPPIASDIAAGLSFLRSTVDETYTEPPSDRPAPKRKKGESWPVLPPERALEMGLPFREILAQGVRDSLFRTFSAFYLNVRAALGPTPVCWYGQQDAWWIAHVDVLRRLGLAAPGAGRELAAWEALARSAGWWWPGDDRCVLVERPALVQPKRVEYRDGWTVTAAV
ncbi:DUF6745 domain-containing protein [Paractinoplanes atraurantiacus]|uniref:Uncharacterized protein n=1 Tax=Paractinoplanes atraurantiacus TaxID=1036182 RepID=A0A285IP68_9ACTN|nr:hypothetical protein [Actinoplanes atraurantiacus]SNY49788.1 hypothetical protein SAMN05421748_110128 [Actinoplanes atraurantiacus]